MLSILLIGCFSVTLTLVDMDMNAAFGRTKRRRRLRPGLTRRNALTERRRMKRINDGCRMGPLRGLAGSMR